MDISAINQFLPLDSSSKITSFTKFLASITPEERLPLDFCVLYVYDDKLEELFFKKCIKLGLYKNATEFIGSKMQNIYKGRENTHDAIIEKKKSISTFLREYAYKESVKSQPIVPAVSVPAEEVRQSLPDRIEGKKRIATIPASQLAIDKGVITFIERFNDNGKPRKKRWILESVRIPGVDNKILSKIDHQFTLLEDFTKSRKNGDNRFDFYPYNDLSFLLAEIERLSSKDKSNHIVGNFPDDGQFELPWDNVKFYDHIMYLLHPNTSKRGTEQPFNFRHTSILRSFQDILPYIESRCSPFLVESKDGVIINVLNFKSFEKAIPQFLSHLKNSYVDEKDEPNLPLFIGSSFSKTDFENRKQVKKSPYLSFLSKYQVNNRRIIYLMEYCSHESAENDTEEFGYLFTIKESNGVSIVLFENISDESRSTIKFYVKTENFDPAIVWIRNFLSGDTKNKRQKLSYHHILYPRELFWSIGRIIHNDFYTWRRQFPYL